MSEKPLQFWFDLASTYSYPAAMRIESLAGSSGVRVCWRPFLLGPIFRNQCWSDSPFNVYPAKGRYMWEDMGRVCRRLGIPFRRPSVFPRNSVLAARVACRFQEESWLPEFVRRVYGANFAEDRDIASEAVVGGILESMGVAGDALEVATSPAGKEKLRSQTQEAMDLGIFGAPTFMVGGEMFWGNDRLEWAVECAEQRTYRRATPA